MLKMILVRENKRNINVKLVFRLALLRSP